MSGFKFPVTDTHLSEWQDQKQNILRRFILIMSEIIINIRSVYIACTILHAHDNTTIKPVTTVQCLMNISEYYDDVISQLYSIHHGFTWRIL